MTERTVVRLEDGLPPEMIDKWSSLADSQGASFFQTPEWCLSWWETVAGRAETRVALWMQETEPVAMAALSRIRQRIHRRIPVGVSAWSTTGSGIAAADHCGPLTGESTSGLVREWISEVAASEVVLLKNLDPSLKSTVPVNAIRLSSIPCPRVTLDAGLHAAASGNFRRQLRSYTRRLADRYVTFEWLGPGTFGTDDLATLLNLHGRRSLLRGRPSSFLPEGPALHRSLIDRATPTVGPAGVVARAGGRPVGMLYGFWWRDTFAAYQSGWEPELAPLNIGIVLISMAMGFAAEHGARTFDLLRGDEPYKYRFGASDRVDTTWLVPGRLSARVLVAKERLREALRR